MGLGSMGRAAGGSQVVLFSGQISMADLPCGHVACVRRYTFGMQTIREASKEMESGVVQILGPVEMNRYRLNGAIKVQCLVPCSRIPAVPFTVPDITYTGIRVRISYFQTQQRTVLR